MMTAEMIEDAKRACLKQSFGGSLDERENELLRTYLQTEDGTQYMNESSEMKNLLSDVAVVEPIDSAKMVAEFEVMLRDRLSNVRRKMPLAFLCTSAVWGLGGALCLGSGSSRLEAMGWGLLILSLFFGVFIVAMWRKQTSLIKDDGILERMDEDRLRAKDPAVIARSVVLAVLFVAVLGYGVVEALGLSGLVAWSLGSAVMLSFGYIFYAAQKRKDQEFWDWWEGR